MPVNHSGPSALTSISAPTTRAAAPIRTTERRYYLTMMLAVTAALVLGLSRSPLLPGHVWKLESFFYVHSAVMFEWMLLFAVQVALVSAKNVKLHRTFGTMAFALIPIIVISGVPAAMITGGRLGPAGQPPVGGQLSFMGALFIMLIMFTAYAPLGMAWRTSA